MEYFGTDGIRLPVKSFKYTFFKKVAKAIALYFNEKDLTPTLLVGNDGRISSDFILSSLESSLLSLGVKVENVGTCSSPCLAFLTKKHKYPLGLMITASHNNSNFNGLKFFNTLGEKVGDDFESHFEDLMKSKKRIKLKFEKRKQSEDLVNDYIRHLKRLKKNNINCIFDCAFGGTSEIVKQLFPKHRIINANPNGTNINENAGCTQIKMLQKVCIKEKKIGFAFDGDGDRVFCVDEKGEILEGDDLLFILSNIYLNQGDKLVGTIYTNSALEKSLTKRGMELIRVPVGDKEISKKMNEINSSLGGENSGHIILKPFTPTGDGLLISILICNIMQITKKSLNELVSNFKKNFISRASLSYNNLDLDKLLSDIKNSQFSSRVITRKSGTEPVLRVFVENEDMETAKKEFNEILNLYNKSLNF
ncbi:MAG: hypothetical protein E7374_00085 [Clostridiales bacterium]|nr:hypothetical protein [Clostridiales bacterium]